MNINFKRQIGFAALAAVGAMAVGMGEPKADPITRYGIFTSDHCTGGCGVDDTHPGGTVTVVDDGLGTGGNVGTLSFDVELSGGRVFVATGGGANGFAASFGFNLIDNPTITYSGIQSDPSAPGGFHIVDLIPGDPSPPDQGASVLKMDGTGNFEYGLDVNANGFGNNAGSFVKFSISGVNLDVTDLKELNDQLQFMAADVFYQTGGPGVGNTGAIDLSIPLSPTPFCTNPNGCTDVPEPGSLAALGSGLVSFGAILWWQQRRRRSGSDNGPALSA